MPPDAVLDRVRGLKPLDRLLYWVTERESVRRKRALGLPAPWTDDPILRTYRFCCPRRMDDRVSMWLLDNWYRPYRDHPNMLTAIALARQLNTIDALAAVGFPEVWDPVRIQQVLEGRAAAGLRNYSAAYMITANYGARGRPKESKPYQTVWRVANPLVGRTVPTGDLRDAWESLLGLQGFSSFIAGQVVADLRWALSGRWGDRYTWAPVGPGSARGLARLMYPDGWADAAKAFAGHPAQWVLAFREHVLIRVPTQLPDDLAERMEAMDYQSILCEFDKYDRTLYGEGRPKQNYPGGGK